MKKIILLAIMALAFVAIPVNAQTRKDKKSAEKQAWELAQKHAIEEAELIHKIKMDSIRAAATAQTQAEAAAQAAAAAQAQAEAAAAAAAAQAEAAARAQAQAAAVAQAQAEAAAQAQAQAAAAAQAQAEAAVKAAQGIDIEIPCDGYISTSELLRGMGVGDDYDQQTSLESAREAAIEDLSSQIETRVQSLVLNYKKTKRENLSRESHQYLQSMTKSVVDVATGFRVICRQWKPYVQNGELIYKCYVVIEIGSGEILKPIYEGIQENAELTLEYDFEKFKEVFDEELLNNIQ